MFIDEISKVNKVILSSILFFLTIFSNFILDFKLRKCEVKVIENSKFNDITILDINSLKNFLKELRLKFNLVFYLSLLLKPFHYFSL